MKKIPLPRTVRRAEPDGADHALARDRGAGDGRGGVGGVSRGLIRRGGEIPVTVVKAHAGERAAV